MNCIISPCSFSDFANSMSSGAISSDTQMIAPGILCRRTNATALQKTVRTETKLEEILGERDGLYAEVGRVGGELGVCVGRW